MYMNNRQLIKARDTLVRVLSERPDHSTASSNLCDVLTKLKSHEEALFWCRAYLVLNPKSAVKEEVLRDIELHRKILGLKQ